jgi:hypothetical protein
LLHALLLRLSCIRRRNELETAESSMATTSLSNHFVETASMGGAIAAAALWDERCRHHRGRKRGGAFSATTVRSYPHQETAGKPKAAMPLSLGIYQSSMNDAGTPFSKGFWRILAKQDLGV